MKNLLVLILLSSCSLNKVTMKEYFSHIHKSGRYEVREVIGTGAVLKHYSDTINIFNSKVKAGDFIDVTVLK